MTDRQPPTLATWILRHVARGNDALVGDLIEEFRRRQSSGWYWRQVLTSAVVYGSKEALIASGVAAVLLVGSYVTIPGADASVTALVRRAAVGRPFGQFVLTAWWQLSGVTVFALGINPYVSAAFLVQAVALLVRFVNRHRPTPVRVPIVASTWSVAMLLSVTQALGLAMFLERVSSVDSASPIVDTPGWTFRITTLITLTAGTACLMVISDQISKRHLGNGMLIVFLAGTAVAFSGALWPLLTGQMDPFGVLPVLAMNTLIVAVIAHGYRRAIEREQLAA